MFDEKISDEHLKELGRVVLHFAGLEHLVDSLNSRLVNRGDDIGDIIGAQLSFKNKLNLLDALIRDRVDDAGVLDSLKKSVGRAIAAEEERNRIIHSDWIADEGEGGLIFRVKSTARQGHGLKRSNDSFAPEDLRKVAQHLHDAAEALFHTYHLFYKATKSQES